MSARVWAARAVAFYFAIASGLSNVAAAQIWPTRPVTMVVPLGAGSAAHLACVLLNAAIGVKITHVPYRGGGAAMQDLVAGLIDYQCPASTIAAPQIDAHQVKAIATLTKDRSLNLPGLATAQEQGLSEFDAGIWYALFLPRDTPPEIVSKLHD